MERTQQATQMLGVFWSFGKIGMVCLLLMAEMARAVIYPERQWPMSTKLPIFSKLWCKIWTPWKIFLRSKRGQTSRSCYMQRTANIWKSLQYFLSALVWQEGLHLLKPRSWLYMAGEDMDSAGWSCLGHKCFLRPNVTCEKSSTKRWIMFAKSCNLRWP